jgi:predicted nucleic acid-binding protein
LILERCQSGAGELIGSEAIDLEIAQIPEPERLQKVRHALSVAKTKVPASDTIKQRARQIAELGFKSYDALHLASAEAAQAEIFLTTDDRLLKKATREAERLQVESANPVFWLMAVNEREGGEEK